MRVFFFLFLFVFSSPLFSQPQALSEAQKSWVDSINTIYGKKNPWFDSLMQADGKCVPMQSLDHFKNEDTTKDVLHFFRELHPHNEMVYDSPPTVSFDYYPGKKKIIAAYGPEIYLRPSGALIMEFSYTGWGAGINGILIYSGNDTIFNSHKSNHRDTVLPGFDRPEMKFVFAGQSNPNPILATIIVLAPLKKIEGRDRQKLTLMECRFVSAEYPTTAATYPVFRSSFVVTVPDSVAAHCQPGDTLFTELAAHYETDAVKKISYSYFDAVMVFPFRASEMERFIIYAGVQMQSLPFQRTKKEIRSYNRFVKRKPKQNDPQGIYHDPVLRWLYREKKYSELHK